MQRQLGSGCIHVAPQRHLPYPRLIHRAIHQATNSNIVQLESNTFKVFLATFKDFRSALYHSSNSFLIYILLTSYNTATLSDFSLYLGYGSIESFMQLPIAFSNKITPTIALHSLTLPPPPHPSPPPLLPP